MVMLESWTLTQVAALWRLIVADEPFKRTSDSQPGQASPGAAIGLLAQSMFQVMYRTKLLWLTNKLSFPKYGKSMALYFGHEQ